MGDLHVYLASCCGGSDTASRSSAVYNPTVLTLIKLPYMHASVVDPTAVARFSTSHTAVARNRLEISSLSCCQLETCWEEFAHMVKAIVGLLP